MYHFDIKNINSFILTQFVTNKHLFITKINKNIFI